MIFFHFFIITCFLHETDLRSDNCPAWSEKFYTLFATTSESPLPRCSLRGRFDPIVCFNTGRAFVIFTDIYFVCVSHDTFTLIIVFKLYVT